ncbi:MAG: alpha-N-arabinofuranosidase [Bacteroidetes bacterium]|nr:alpha-N-arabinofuranosidase [Bacteroidota bacterium]
MIAFSQDVITVRAGSPGAVINKNIYGHFSEHLGHCIYNGFYVGDTNKTIPNTAGVRNDVIAALRKLKIPLLRWPGGCFADTYHWKDGIGPKDKRPTIVNKWWGGVTEDNSFGTHDFLNMCEELGAEPYLCGNVGSGTVQELADWVQYTTFDGKSPMSDLRRANGREKPWNVKYWGIGNEAWGCGGNMRPEYYADNFRKYVNFMGGNVFRIASGASSSDYQWTETLMKNIPTYLIDGIGMHHYAVIDWDHKSSATNFTEQQYFTTMQRALLMEEYVTKHSAIMDKYDSAKKVALVVDEWGGWYDVEPGTNPGFLFQQNTMRDAMIAGVTLNIFNNHCDRVRMANLAQTINVLQAVILTDKEKIILTPTYHVMEMYNVHQDATLLPVSVKTTDYTLNNEKLPAISASASKDKNGAMHISVVNIDAEKKQDVTINVEGATFKTITGRLLSSPKIQDHNTFDNPEKVKPSSFTGFRYTGNSVSMQLPPASVVVLEVK